MSKFIEVDAIPNTHGNQYHKLNADWKEFMGMNVKIVKVDLTQYNYKVSRNAAQTMRTSVRKWGYPIEVFERRGEIFLLRRDL